MWRFARRVTIKRITLTRVTLKRLAFAAVVFCLLGVGIVALLPRMIAGDRASVPEVTSTLHEPVADASGDGLTVVTLNLAHGRRDAASQFSLEASDIRQNLEDVGSLLRGTKPHVVALQEADGPSFWSGRFDHVAHLADGMKAKCYCRACNVDGFSLSYGAAMLSNLVIRDVRAVTFEPGYWSFPKGAIVGSIVWPGSAPAEYVDLVSVHLDFKSDGSRQRQLDELAAVLESRPGRSRVVMGDFNCDWQGGRPLRSFATRLDLHTYRPEDSDVITFPTRGTRIDWILLSSDLEFESFEVLDDVVSDHRAVVAMIARRS